MNNPSPPAPRRDRRDWVGLIQADLAATAVLTTPGTSLPENRPETSSARGSRRSASDLIFQPDPTEGGNHDPI